MTRDPCPLYPQNNASQPVPAEYISTISRELREKHREKVEEALDLAETMLLAAQAEAEEERKRQEAARAAEEQLREAERMEDEQENARLEKFVLRRRPWRRCGQLLRELLAGRRRDAGAGGVGGGAVDARESHAGALEDSAGAAERTFIGDTANNTLSHHFGLDDDTAAAAAGGAKQRKMQWVDEAADGSTRPLERHKSAGRAVVSLLRSLSTAVSNAFESPGASRIRGGAGNGSGGPSGARRVHPEPLERADDDDDLQTGTVTGGILDWMRGPSGRREVTDTGAQDQQISPAASQRAQNAGPSSPRGWFPTTGSNGHGDGVGGSSKQPFGKGASRTGGGRDSRGAAQDLAGATRASSGLPYQESLGRVQSSEEGASPSRASVGARANAIIAATGRQSFSQQTPRALQPRPSFNAANGIANMLASQQSGAGPGGPFVQGSGGAGAAAAAGGLSAGLPSRVDQVEAFSYAPSNRVVMPMSAVSPSGRGAAFGSALGSPVNPLRALPTARPGGGASTMFGANDPRLPGQVGGALRQPSMGGPGGAYSNVVVPAFVRAEASVRGGPQTYFSLGQPPSPAAPQPRPSQMGLQALYARPAGGAVVAVDYRVQASMRGGAFGPMARAYSRGPG